CHPIPIQHMEGRTIQLISYGTIASHPVAEFLFSIPLQVQVCRNGLPLIWVMLPNSAGLKWFTEGRALNGHIKTAHLRNSKCGGPLQHQTLRVAGMDGSS